MVRENGKKGVPTAVSEEITAPKALIARNTDVPKRAPRAPRVARAATMRAPPSTRASAAASSAAAAAALDATRQRRGAPSSASDGGVRGRSGVREGGHYRARAASRSQERSGAAGHPGRRGKGSKDGGVGLNSDEGFLLKMETSYGSRLLMHATMRASDLASEVRKKVSAAESSAGSGARTRGTSSASAASSSSSSSSSRSSSRSSSLSSQGDKARSRDPRERRRRQRRHVKNFSEDLATIQMLKDIFDEYDTNHSGSLNRVELHAALEVRSPYIARHFFDMFDAMDRDKSGAITFSEMLHELYPRATRAQILRMSQSVGLFCSNKNDKTAKRKLTKQEREDIASIFSLYDTDGDGTLTAEELRASLGEGVTDEDVAALILNFDKNGDQCLDIDEFTTMMT